MLVRSLAARPAATTPDITAAPDDAPSSWNVLSRPDALPALCGSTWLSAETDATTKRAPRPIAARVAAATLGDAPASIDASARPDDVTSRPATATTRGPNRAIAGPPSCAPAIVAIASGRKS